MPVVFINLFNNQWDSEFPVMEPGHLDYQREAVVGATAEAEPALITPSLEARYPLSAAVGTGAAGSLPVSRRGLALSQKGILVTAFGDRSRWARHDH